MAQVATGRFGADMQVTLTHDGPVTYWLRVQLAEVESRRWARHSGKFKNINKNNNLKLFAGGVAQLELARFAPI